jgi:hypothetical protein
MPVVVSVEYALGSLRRLRTMLPQVSKLLLKCSCNNVPSTYLGPLLEFAHLCVPQYI